MSQNTNSSRKTPPAGILSDKPLRPQRGYEYLTLDRAELWKVGAKEAGAKDKTEDWEKATVEDVCRGLFAKGQFLQDFTAGEMPSLLTISFALLRLGAAAQNKDPAVAWCCRGFAFLLDRTARNASEEISEKLDALQASMQRAPRAYGLGGRDEQREELDAISRRLAQSLAATVEKTTENMTAQSAGTTQPATYANVAASATRSKTRQQIEMLARADERLMTVLIENASTDDLSEREIVEKARLAGEFMANEEKPSDLRFLGAKKLKGGAVLLRLNTPAAADWIRANASAFASGMGSGAAFKERYYNLILEFVPKTFDPRDNASLRALEEDNNLSEGAVASARHLKPTEKHHPTQKVAHVVLALPKAKNANHILRHGLYIEKKWVKGRKLRNEPHRCLKCQEIGANHIAATCPKPDDTCARCAGAHKTTECTATADELSCANCEKTDEHGRGRGHGAADRQCPAFQAKLRLALERDPDAKYVYFPEPDDETMWLEIGKDSVDAPSDEGWQTIMNARARRPGASAETARTLQRAMTRGPRVAFAAGRPERQAAITEHFRAGPNLIRAASRPSGLRNASEPSTNQTLDQ
ncbi:RNA-directed DNA polymerase from transposon X-element [Mycena kentingensis (nom. inval.)]|nr:RNA-directed DNA polymerase from transposon X-element [Mycena kentingensis (nom. inval.)]